MPTTDATPLALRPYLTADHEQLWAEAEKFAADHVAPCVPRMEASPHEVERELPQLMSERGWFGVTIPRQYGGMGAGHVAKTVLIHRLAMVSAATAAILQATLIPVGALTHWGTVEQKQKWLPQVADGTVLLSIAVTEPDAGGHIGGIETVAELAGDEWVITGEKIHIGNSHIAGLHVVVARTAPPGVAASQALTAFLVENHSAGLTVAAHRARLGLHGFSAGRLVLDRVRIPAANVLGEVGQGLYVAQSSSILYGRPNLTAVSLGIHEALVETTAHFLSNRPRYDGYLSDQPVVQDRLGEMQGRLQTALTTAYSAVHLLDHRVACDSQLIGAKHTGHHLAALTARDAMELHGAHALDADYKLQRLFRDIQHTYPPAGTGEFQRIHLARAALGQDLIQWSQRLAAEASWARPDPTAA
ncbi:acyl-CoA dehydrogenase family protein [Streptomyces sp. TRM68367]|uniref:acyl-CoA dehydrogenase family protein n=1 Tax=Streptomyces sp. TRM68367 TaxID=2758415 RepID=UPI00165A8D99|nr:acyl-CoA dehydrogenase family protein [Streptomyces sp. TRM68367]MBC9724971.1 acyl-CoA/acyl-ACP dehydrogenase [Streptomyces sp. TRM68367]